MVVVTLTVHFWLRLEKVGDVGRSRLCKLPDVVLNLIASQLNRHEILNRLLPAYPSLAKKLRNGLLWSNYNHDGRFVWGRILDDCRVLSLLSADSLQNYEGK
jgi:hypothetical protein